MTVRSTTRSYGMVALGLFVATATSAPARAQAPANADQASAYQPGPWDRGVSAAHRQAAYQLMQEGNRLIKVPLFAQAAARYREALALWPHPAIHYNLGVAELNLVQPMEAYKSFGRAMQYGPGPLGQEKFARAREYLAVLETRLARIVVSCEIASAVVTLDGERLFVGPGARDELVSPGQHQLVADRPGYVPDTRQVALSPGERVQVSLVPRSVDEVARRERRWAVWKPWVAVAASAGLIAGAGYLDWRSSRAFDDFDRGFEVECRPRGCKGSDIAELVADKERAEIEQRVALGLYIAGGTAMALGAALLYFNRETLVHRQERFPDVAIRPLVTDGGGGLSARIRF